MDFISTIAAMLSRYNEIFFYTVTVYTVTFYDTVTFVLLNWQKMSHDFGEVCGSVTLALHPFAVKTKIALCRASKRQKKYNNKLL